MEALGQFLSAIEMILNDMNTSARMLRLLSLLQTHRYWPGEPSWPTGSRSAAGRLRRDMDRLRELGYAVDAVARRRPAATKLRAGGALPPLLLEDEEAVAIAVGLRTAAAGCGRRAGGDVGAGADQGDRADAAAAAAADGRAAARRPSRPVAWGGGPAVERAAC